MNVAYDRDLMQTLRRHDTPTICNALEIATGGRRATGFTREQVVAAFPALPPIVGYARTATLRAAAPSPLSPDEMRDQRLAYYDYVASIDDVPTVVVMQDLDFHVGIGAFWGEVNSKLHARLGCAGVITNGALRDLDMLTPSLQILAGRITPSHAFVRVEAVGQSVNIFGMDVAHDDLIHADRHGAVVIPAEAAGRLPHAIEVITRRERLLLEAADRPGFGIAEIRAALMAGDDIH